MMTINLAVVSLSGGKDSTATALLALDSGQPVKCVFADTGNEHEATYEYVNEYLPKALGVPVDTVREDFTARIAHKRKYVEEKWPTKGVPDSTVRAALAILHPTGVPFLDLCLWKGRWPSRMAQFCTQELKRRPLDRYLFEQATDGRRIDQVESWRGIRRDESRNRSDARDREQAAEGWWVVHPIADWTAQQTVDFSISRGVKLNPLYSQGMNRVGCMPCINCSKGELRQIGLRFPEHVQRIAEWERIVGQAAKRQWSSFFTGAAKDGDQPEDIFNRFRIEERVKWAKTTHGGKQYDLLGEIESPACMSTYGLCE